MLLHDVFVPTTRAAAACSGRCTTPSPSLPELPGDLPRAHASGLGGALAYLTAVCGGTHPAHRDSGKGSRDHRDALCDRIRPRALLPSSFGGPGRCSAGTAQRARRRTSTCSARSSRSPRRRSASVVDGPSSGAIRPSGMIAAPRVTTGASPQVSSPAPPCALNRRSICATGSFSATSALPLGLSADGGHSVAPNRTSRFEPRRRT